MIVRCPDCQAKYEIANAMVPATGVRVRCPKCKAVFPIRRESDASPEIAPTAPAAAPVAAAPSGVPPVKASPPTNGHGLDDLPVVPRAPRPVSDPVVAKRMARAVVFEILSGRREEHERTVADGTVLSTFGTALASAFVQFRERVSPDLPDADAIFRAAINDILGRGEPVL